MTIITRKLRRETAARERSKPLVVELEPHGVRIRRKGERTAYSVPWLAVYQTGARIAAREREAEKRAARKGGRRR